jgi:hypothetical protein
LDFKKWLETNPEKKVTIADIKDIFNSAFVKVWSNDPSFWWQGLCWNLTQIDGAIYECDIKPKKWNATNLHNEEGFLNKHMAGIMNSMPFWFNPLAAMINKYYERG